MTLRLKPCTIIPPELYVIREADKQLRNVLHDMGRPGYILVARQMGKTNLLLNAKRELEDAQDELDKLNFQLKRKDKIIAEF